MQKNHSERRSAGQTPAKMRQAATIRAPHLPFWIVALPTALALLASVYIAATSSVLVPSAAGCMIAWFALSFLFSLFSKRHFVPGFLGGLLFLLAGWRLAGPLDIEIVIWPAAIAAVLYVLQFLDAAFDDRKRGTSALMSVAQWQMTFIRIYIALDMIPHFTEKLFAGPVPFHEDVAILTKYGITQAALSVIVGGLCELGTAIGLSFGFLTRVAGAGAAFYYLSTSLIGHHFSKGFIWNLNGGGWEYPLLMLVLFLSYSFSGAGRFSVDYWLAERGCTPRFIQILGLGDDARKSLNEK